MNRLAVVANFLRENNVKSYVKRAWSVSWPMMFIMLFEFLITLTDVLVSGLLGTEFQASYGFAAKIYFIFIVIAYALSVGTVSVVSRLFTSKDKENLHNAIFSSLVLAVVIGFGIAVLGFSLSPFIIRQFNMPEEINTFGIPLIQIYTAGLLFSSTLTITNAVLRACDMVKKSLITMAIVTGMNICLDFALVFLTPLGFRGIAVATVASVATGVLLNSRYIRKLIPHWGRYSGELSKQIVKIGWPIGLLQVAWQSGYAVLYFILKEVPHNISVMAGFTAGMQIESAVFLPAIAFNLASAVIVGNALGANRKDEAFRGGMVNATIGTVIIIVLSVIVILNVGGLVSLLSRDEAVIKAGMMYLYIVLLSEPFMAWGIILAGGLNGAGDTKSVMIIVALSIWLVRIPLSFLLGVVLKFGAPGVWWAMNASIVTQTFFLFYRYMKKRWLTDA